MFIRLAVMIVTLIGLGMAQNWEVVSEDKITDSDDGLYFYPQFSPDGNKLYYTTSTYKGLFSYDLNSREQHYLTKADGAGYRPVFSENGKKIYFRENSYKNRKRQSFLIELDIEKRLEHRIDTGQNQVINPTLVDDQRLIFQTDPQFEVVDLKSHQVSKSVSIEKAVVYTKDLDLYIYRNNISKKLQSLGEGHYIWASFSPNQKNILFTLAGRGTFISDLDGNILHELGYAHTPKWSPDGQWILYMVDHDDGHQYTSSNIYISNLSGNDKYLLTNDDMIALHPNWSPDGQRITFHSDKGEIYLMHVSYERSAE